MFNDGLSSPLVPADYLLMLALASATLGSISYILWYFNDDEVYRAFKRSVTKARTLTCALLFIVFVLLSQIVK